MSFGGRALGFLESVAAWPVWLKVVVGMLIMAGIGAVVGTRI